MGYHAPNKVSQNKVWEALSYRFEYLKPETIQTTAQLWSSTKNVGWWIEAQFSYAADRAEFAAKWFECRNLPLIESARVENYKQP